MKYLTYKKFHIHTFQDSGISLGFHISQTWKRIDFHFIIWIISIGKVPVYQFGGKSFAVSDSFHEKMMKKTKMVYNEPSGDLNF